MRLTLLIPDDVLQAAQCIAEERGQRLDTVIATLLRMALYDEGHLRERNGIRLIQPGLRAEPRTLELVNELRGDS